MNDTTSGADEVACFYCWDAMAAVARRVAVKIALTKFGNLVDLGLGNVKNVSRAFPTAAPDDYNCATGIVLRYDFIAPCVFARTRKPKKKKKRCLSLLEATIRHMSHLGRLGHRQLISNKSYHSLYMG